jgi:hypothetical protein
MVLHIVTSHWKEDLDWLKKSKWQVVLVDKEGAYPSWIVPQHVIPNSGRETSAYLKYIIENYDNLPDHVAFIHGHEEAHHHKHDRPLLEVIEGANVAEFDFIPLNNFFTKKPFVDDDMSLPTGFLEIETFWDKFNVPARKPPYFADMIIPMGAQFIVSSRRIRRHPKSLYEFWYKIVIEERDKNWPYCFEATWHIIFGEFWQCDRRDEWFNFPHKRVWWLP